jgi:hypothetical protein
VTTPLRIALSALCLALPACLEVEEEIDVRADGSVEVRVRAHGDAADLAEGHPVPTGGPWEAEDAGTASWLAGSPPPLRDGQKDEVAVGVRASFASVDELPRWFAPPETLYRSACEERATSLEVLRRGARTVYVFERRLPVKSRSAWNANARIIEGLPEDVQEALDDGLPLRPHQWRQAVRTIQEAYADAFDGVLEQALLALYVEGSAELSAEGCVRARAAARAAIVARLDESRLERLFQVWQALESGQGDQDELPLDVDLDRQARAATRGALPAALQAESLAPEVVNAVLERVEWGFAAIDRAVDRGDETLKLRVRLPGRIVGGNFDELRADGRAEWELEGETAWRDGELVLRAVSVLE